jgi:hypothetical protein
MQVHPTSSGRRRDRTVRPLLVQPGRCGESHGAPSVMDSVAYKSRVPAMPLQTPSGHITQVATEFSVQPSNIWCPLNIWCRGNWQGFCTDEEYEEFLDTVPQLEDMLQRSGIHLLKYWFSVRPWDPNSPPRSRPLPSDSHSGHRGCLLCDAF